MTKKFLRLFITALLAGFITISCNEVFAPEVNFGDNTYVNDYKDLVEQIKNIGDRIDLLNKILNENFEGIRISIDENTKAIIAQTDKLSGDLEEVMATLFNGFSALSCKINSLGEQIVYAINEQGDIIALSINQNGALISSSIEANAFELLKAINSRFGSLESRFEALNEAIKVGLAEIAAECSVPGEILKLELKAISDALKNIDSSILSGFTSLNTTVNKNGERVVYAINSKGEILATAIDDTGKLISAAIVCQVKELVRTINNAAMSMDKRLNAIQIAINSGLASISITNKKVGEKLNASLDDISDMLDGMTTELFKDFKVLSSTILSGDQELIKAIDRNGVKIALTIDKNGKLISASIDSVVESLDELKAILESTEKTLAEKFDALNSAISSGIDSIIFTLNQQTGTLSLKLGDIESELFKGFTMTSNRIAETGYGIIFAIDRNGMLISTTVDKNGQLISAEIKGSAKDLVDAINSHKTAIADKIDALNTIVESGLATINVTLGNIGGMLDMELTDIHDALKGIDKNIVKGYEVLSVVEFENGNKIAKAIDNNGNRIAFTIDSNGKLIAVKLDGVIKGLEDLIAVLEDQTKCLEEKFNALNKTIADGDESIEIAIKQLSDDISLEINGVASTLLDGFEALNSTIVKEGERLLYAINENGQLIAVTMTEEGKLLRASVAGLAEDIVAAINNQTGNLGAKLKALTTVTETGLARIEVKLGAVGDALAVSLKDINDAIRDMDTTIFKGFQLTGEYMFRGGEVIARAINRNGEKIALRIDKNGKLIEAKLAGVIDSIEDLVAALADEKDSLCEKFDILNKAIADGMEDITVAVDKNTRTIKLKLSDINATLFDGFDGLNETITKEGERLVYAVNTKGDLIALKLDDNGALIEAAIAGNTEGIVNAINNQAKDLKACIDSLNLLVETGLANIEVTLGEVGDALEAKLTNINKNLKGINKTILDGFTIVSEQMAADNSALVEAINDLGQKITFSINYNGRVLHIDLGNIADAIKNLAAYLESAGVSLTAKLDSLNKAIADGMEGITVAVNKNTKTLKLKLGEINTTLLDGFDGLNEVITTEGERILYAVNSKGDLIALKLDDNGALIEAAIAGNTEGIVNAINNQAKDLKACIDSLNLLVETGLANIEVTLGEVGDALDARLSSINKNLKGINTTILDGFTIVSKQMADDNSALVKAINDLGQEITLSINDRGWLIHIDLENIADAIKGLKAYLESAGVSLTAKLDSLNKAIAEGMEGINVAVNKNTKTLKLKLGEINTTLLDGFDGLNEVITTEGERILYAVNSKGDLIALTLDNHGGLLEAAIEANTKNIKKALEDQTTQTQAVADKVDAINTTVETGLGAIKVSLDTVSKKIETSYDDLSGALGTISTNILGGFSGVNTNLEKIEAALKAMRDTIKLHIDANTEAVLKLDADLKESLKALADSVSAIGGKVVVAINGQKEAIVLGLGADGAIAKAVNAGAVTISNAVTAQTKSLTDLLNDKTGGLPALLASIDSTDKDIVDILNYLKEKPDVDLSEIIKLLGINNNLLTELLAISDGIYLDESKLIKEGEYKDKYSAVYLTAETREAADKSEETGIAIASLLAMEAQMTAPSKTQYVTQTYGNDKKPLDGASYDYSEATKHGHSIWKRVRAYEGMIYSTGVTITDKDNKTLVEVKARSTKEIWLIKIHEVCSFRMIYGIKKDDVDGLKYDYYAARYVNSDKQVTGPNPDFLVDGKKISEYKDKPSNEDDYSSAHTNYPKWYNGGAAPIPVIFNIYNKETGEYIQPEAYIYCIQTGFSKPYKGTNESTKWIPKDAGNDYQLDDDGVWPNDIQKYTNDWLAAHPDIR